MQESGISTSFEKLGSAYTTTKAGRRRLTNKEAEELYEYEHGQKPNFAKGQVRKERQTDEHAGVVLQPERFLIPNSRTKELAQQTFAFVGGEEHRLHEFS